jgi:CheY-like chemotaxis protein
MAAATAEDDSLPMRILVVDDNLVVRGIAREIAEDAGYEAHDAGSAAEAMIWARGHEFDVLLTDLVMPDVDGIHLAEAIKQHDSSVRVLYTSGYVDMSWTGNFIQKPYTRAELVKALDALYAT